MTPPVPAPPDPARPAPLGPVAEAQAMVREQVAARGVADTRVLEAMGRLDRRLFVPDRHRADAFSDNALPLLHGQTISQPYIVAAMTEALRLEPAHRVLEVGTGSGYQTAVLALLARHVTTVEQDPELAIEADTRLRGVFRYKNIEFVVGDGSRGWATNAPYDRIIVTAAAPAVPAALFRQLLVGGILVAPEGESGHGLLGEPRQVLRRWTKDEQGRLHVEDLMDVRFVPLIEGGSEPHALRPGQ